MQIIERSQNIEFSLNTALKESNPKLSTSPSFPVWASGFIKLSYLSCFSSKLHKTQLAEKENKQTKNPKNKGLLESKLYKLNKNKQKFKN